MIEWNNTSRYRENIIPDIQWNGERNIRFGDDGLWMEIMEYEAGDILAVRYEKQAADGRIWDSDYVVNFREKKICIRLDRSYADEALITDPSFSTPHIITMLIERGYLEKDAGLEVLRKPVTVRPKDSVWLFGIFRGRKRYHLPIVYVSTKRSGAPAVDVDLLAARLKGAAHVLVADSKECGRVFREECNPKAETGGEIGIYYLDSVRRHKRFRCERYEKKPELLLDRIVNHVISYAKIRSVDGMYTFNGVRQTVLQERASLAREERMRMEEESRAAISRGEEAENYANDLIASVDEEIRSLEDQVEDLKKQLAASQAENIGLRAKMNGLTSMPILYMGDEPDLYEGEIKDILLSELAEGRKNAYDGSRRADILDDIIAANGYRHTSEQRSKRIREIFKGYRTLSGAMRNELESMGMDFSAEGNHYKIKYYGDDRYYSILAKTASDHREGENISHQIIRDML